MQKKRTFGVDCTGVLLGSSTGGWIEVGVDDESDGSLSWRQSPGSVTRDSIVHSYTGLPLKEAYTTHIMVAKEWIVGR